MDPEVERGPILEVRSAGGMSVVCKGGNGERMNESSAASRDVNKI